MDRLLIFITKKIIRSINFANVPQNILSNGILVLAEPSLKILFSYPFKATNKKNIFSPGHSAAENVLGVNSISLSKIRKAPAAVYFEEHTNEQLKGMWSLCYPILKENGEIIAYLGIFLENENVESSMFLFWQMMSKLIYNSLRYCNLLKSLKALKIKGKNNIKLLTDKEYSIVKMIAKGKTDSEISKELLISRSTVRAHLGSIFEKLGINNRSELIAQFYDAKISELFKNMI